MKFVLKYFVGLFRSIRLLLHNGLYMKSTDFETRIFKLINIIDMKTKFRLTNIARYFLYTLLLTCIFCATTYSQNGLYVTNCKRRLLMHNIFAEKYLNQW